MASTVRHSLVFGLGGAVNSILGFVLIPIYARHLKAAQFGNLSLLLIVLTIGSVLCKFGLNHAFFRQYCLSADDDPRRRAVGSTFLFLLVSTTVLTAALYFAAPRVSALVFSGDPSRANLVGWVACILFFDVLTVVPYSILRVQFRSVAYSVVMSLAFLIQLGCITILVLFVKANVENVLIGRLAGAIAEASLSLWLVRGDLSFDFSAAELRGMLAFGVPLVFSQILLALFMLIDRFFVERYAGARELGVYSISNQLVRVVPVLVTVPFNQVWMVTRFSALKGGNANAYYARTLTVIVLASTFLALGVAAVGGDGLRLYGLRSYWPAATIIPLLALSTVFDAAARVLNVGLTLKGRTLFAPLLAGLALAVNVGLNFALVPRYGAMGATVSTLLSYLCFCGLRYLVSGLFYRVDYDWPRVAKAVGTGIFLIGSFYLLDFARGANPPRPVIYLSLLAKTVLALLFPVFLVALRFFQKGELRLIAEEGWRLLREVGRRLPKEVASP